MKPGDRVMALEGDSRGYVGVILGPSQYRWDDEQLWRVRWDAEPYREAHVRDSVLGPVPEQSDEDVLGPLRRWRCP